MPSVDMSVSTGKFVLIPHISVFAKLSSTATDPGKSSMGTPFFFHPQSEHHHDKKHENGSVEVQVPIGFHTQSIFKTKVNVVYLYSHSSLTESFLCIIYIYFEATRIYR